MGFSEDFPDLQQEKYPNLLPGTYEVTSPRSKEYNCVAWAANDETTWWWPFDGYYWPQGVRADDTVAAFAEAFGTLGYEACPEGTLESDWEKIVVYATAAGEPTHAARQLRSGRWTSKLGGSRDIAHDLGAITGPNYGEPALFMKRPRQGV